MDALLIVLVSGAALLLAYLTYSRWLSRRIFELDDANPTPAVTEEDDADYVPTRRSVVFGHHFTSIAGTGPIVGPAIAVMWGWLPAILWVVIGAIFIGAVHDLGSLVVSLRSRGRSIGDVAGDILGPRVRLLFLAILIVGLWIVLAIFGLVIASVLRLYPAAITPVLIQVPIAVAIGLLIHRKGRSIVLPSAIALALMYLSVIYGDTGWLHDFNSALAAQPLWMWTVALLAYAYVASVLPVWLLLQPRDYINALQLLTCLALIVAGLVTAALIGGADTSPAGNPPQNPERIPLEVVAPTIDWQPIGAPPLFPVLFITIACGACSGFHCLVGSGTTSKQLHRESDARTVGYGSMLTEGFLATLVIAACAAGIGLGMTRDATTQGLGMAGMDNGLMTWLVTEDTLPLRAEPDSQPVPHVLILGSRWWTRGSNAIDEQSNVERDLRTLLLPPGTSLGSFGSGGPSDAPEVPALDIDVRPPAAAPGQWTAPRLDRTVSSPLALEFANGGVAIAPADTPVTFDPQAGMDAPDTPTIHLTGPIAFDKQYETWASAGSLGAKVSAFVQGAANFLAAMGIPIAIAVALMAVMVASFAATTMDTACRLQRYVIQELSNTFLPRRTHLECRRCAYDLSAHTRGIHVEDTTVITCPECGHDNPAHEIDHHDSPGARVSWHTASPLNPFKWLATIHGATLFAVVSAMLLAFIPPRGASWTLQSAGQGGLILWPLFGATNQLLAGFAFVVITAWLVLRRKPIWFIIPGALLMLVVPASAMTWQAFIGNADNPSWLAQQNWLLVAIAGVTLALEAWLVVEIALRSPSWRRITL